MIIVITGVDEQAVLDRLLSSQMPAHTCHCTAPPQVKEDAAPPCPTFAGSPWSEEEEAAISGSPTVAAAVRVYRQRFPDSDRTAEAVKRRLYALRDTEDERIEAMLQEECAKNPEITEEMWAEKSDAIAAELRDECSAEQIEDEVEMCGEPAGPVDSAIAAEMEGLDPTLAGLQDEDPEPPVCAADEVTSSVEDLEAEQEVVFGTGLWQEAEDLVIVATGSAPGALTAYRARFPASPRTDEAVKARWYTLQQPMHPVRATVQILLKGSPHYLARGTVLRRNVQSREYLVCPDDSMSRIWIREDLVRLVVGRRV